MVTKKDADKKGSALDNFFPGAVSVAVKDSVSASKGERLGTVGSDVEVVTMPQSSAKKAAAEVDAEAAGKVSEEDAVDAEIADEIREVTTAENKQLEESVADTDIVDETLAEEPPDVAEGKTISSQDDVERHSAAEKVEAPLERNDDEIAEALEQNEERKSDILIGLGFNRYDDNKDGKIKYSILENDIKVGVTFDDKNPEGNVWAIYQEDSEGYKAGTSDEGKRGTFLSPIARSQQPLLQKYYAILKGDEPIPKPVIIGKVVERRGGSIGIEFEEEVGGVRTEYYPAEDAVKRDKEGYFIAKGFSKEWKDRNAKMHFPRAIRLPNYEQEFKTAPVDEPSSPERSSKPDASGASVIAPAPEREQSKAPTVTLEKKREQILANLNWAVGAAVEVYKKQVEDQVPITEGLGVFIEKIAVTAFITLEKSLKCVEG